MSDALQVHTTVDDRELAEHIAGELVSRQLAACVQIVGPITSVYRWHGKVETSTEWLCLIKTTRARYAALEAAISRLHRYEVPEIVAVAIEDGSASYLDWLRGVVSDQAP